MYLRISRNNLELRISIIRFMDIHNSIMDILKTADLRISIIRFKDIHNSILKMDVTSGWGEIIVPYIIFLILGYPKMNNGYP